MCISASVHVHPARPVARLQDCVRAGCNKYARAEWARKNISQPGGEAERTWKEEDGAGGEWEKK